MPILGGYVDYVIGFSLHVAALICIFMFTRVHQTPPYAKTDMAIHQKCSASCKNTLCKILLNLDKLYRVHISHENTENVAIG